MLEQLRQNSRSFIIWILFGIIIAAFILTFGTQGGLELRCGAADDNVIMEVDGEEVSVHSWRFVMNNHQGGGSRVQRAQLVLDALLVRELLAQAAEAAGFAISEDQINEQIVKGRLSVFGQQFSAKNLYFRGDVFDYELLERLAQSFGLSSVDYLLIEQKRELLADMMGGLIRQNTPVSADEAEVRFRYENTTATIDAVVFKPTTYQRTLNLSDADIKAYMAEHDQDIRNKFQEDERLYKGVGEQVKVRQIVISKAAPGPAGELPAPAADNGKDTAAAVLQRLKQGEDFGAVAREVSQDQRTKAQGGNLGWRSLKAPGLGANELTEALAKLEVDAISDVIETPRGYYILKVEGKRQGDLTYEQVKEEIAERLANEHYARERARTDALAALEQAKAGKSLEELFERQEQAAPPQPGFDPNTPPEGISPEQWQQILRQLQQQQPSGEQGSVLFESRDIPAQSGAQQAGNTPAPAPAGNEANPPAPATAPAAGAGTAQDSGMTINADGSAAAGGPAAGATPAAGGTPPSQGAAQDRPAQKLQKIGPFTRNIDGSVPPIGKSETLVRDVFDKLSEGQLAPELYEADGSFIIVKLIERKSPDMSKFDDAKKSELIRSLSRERGSNKLMEWVQERCQAVASDVEVNADLLAQFFDQDAAAFSYEPCANVPQLVNGATY